MPQRRRSPRRRPSRHPRTPSYQKRAQKWAQTSSRMPSEYASLALHSAKRRAVGKLSLARNQPQFDASNIKTIHRNGRAYLALPGLRQGSRPRYIVRSPSKVAIGRKLDMNYNYPGFMDAVKASRAADTGYTRAHPSAGFSDNLYAHEVEYLKKIPEYRKQFQNYIHSAMSAEYMKDQRSFLKMAQTLAYFIFPRTSKVHSHIRAAALGRTAPYRERQMLAILGMFDKLPSPPSVPLTSSPIVNAIAAPVQAVTGVVSDIVSGTVSAVSNVVSSVVSGVSSGVSSVAAAVLPTQTPRRSGRIAAQQGGGMKEFRKSLSKRSKALKTELSRLAKKLSRGARSRYAKHQNARNSRMMNRHIKRAHHYGNKLHKSPKKGYETI